MSSKSSIKIDIGNIIPHGNAQCTGQIIALWRQLGELASACPFVAPVKSRSGSTQVACSITLDTGEAIAVMEAARDAAGSFDAFRLKHTDDASLAVAATLTLDIDGEQELTPLAAYEVATIFLQQVVLAMNVALPGSVQMLNTTFRGEQEHQVEAPVFDALVYSGARNAYLAHGWPTVAGPALPAVWQWLDTCETSATRTAIKGINKVLFTLLKIAEQRQDYSARMVLMVLYQLEVLMDCRNPQTYRPLRNRIRQVLGDIPESADCLKDLYQVRASLFSGDQPVRRPTLVHHSARDEITEQLDQHDTMVELGVLLTVALLQDLVNNQATGYAFSESFSRIA